MAAGTPSGLWLGQDGQDLVGPTNTSGPDDVQDVHIAVSGLPADRTVARAVVQGYGADQWTYDIVLGYHSAAWIQAPGASTADLYIDPFRVETGRSFGIALTYDDGQMSVFYVAGGTADPNLRMPHAAVAARWVGQEQLDLTGPGPGVGPDGVQDVHIALTGLSAKVGIDSVSLTAASGAGWAFGPNPTLLANAEFLRHADDPTLADLYINPAAGVAGQSLTLVVNYVDGKSDRTTLVAGAADPALRMPAPAPIAVTRGTIATTWLGQDGLDLTGGRGDVHLALSGLPAGRTVVSAVLTDAARGEWTYRRGVAPIPATDGYLLPLGFTPSAADPTRADLSFPPIRDESGGTLSLRLVLDDGSILVSDVAGGAADPGRRAADLAPTSIVARPGDDLEALANQYGSVHLSSGTYPLSRPILLHHPVAITADPGAVLLFSQGPNDPLWTTAINIGAGNTTLDGFAVRFSGPIRWTTNVDSGPSVIGNSQSLPGGIAHPLVGIELTHLDLQAPPASTDWEEAAHLIWMHNAHSGVIADNTLKGGTVEFYHGPWQVTGNDYRGTLPNTYSSTVFGAHDTHDVTFANNTAADVGPSGKTWRFLVLTVAGYNDVVRDNDVVGIGPMDSDPIPHPNAPEVILTESYRLDFEGAPSSISPDGWVVQIPTPQGGPPRPGSVVAILSGPDAGQWRRITQALSPTAYLLDAPISPADTAISITTGFVGETFEGNTVDARGSTSANDLVLAGNHFGTKVVGNHFLGGQVSFRITAYPTESPNIWGWSHVPFLGGVVQGNAFEDARDGGVLDVEHGPQIKSAWGRTYMSLTFADNLVIWTSDFLAARAAAGLTNPPPAVTVGSSPTADPAELLLTASGNRIAGPADLPAGATWQVAAAVVNGQPTVDADSSLPLVTPVLLGPDLALSLVVDSGASATDRVTNDGRIHVESTAPAAGYEYSLSGAEGTFEPVASVLAFLPAGLVQGANTVYVRAVDAQGGRGPVASIGFVLDTVAPGPVSGLSARSDGFVSFQSVEPGAVYEFRHVGAGAYVALGAATSFTSADLLNGSRMVQVRAIDLAGNAGPDTLTSLEPRWVPVSRPTAAPMPAPPRPAPRPLPTPHAHPVLPLSDRVSNGWPAPPPVRRGAHRRPASLARTGATAPRPKPAGSPWHHLRMQLRILLQRRGHGSR